MDGTDDHGTDARLSVAASQGDDEAFAELYERYAPRIGAYLSRVLDDEHLAQDVTHEVFVSALRRLRTHRPPIAFGPWLYRIARNASIDVHRRAQIVRQVPLDGAAPEPPCIARDNGPEAAAEVRQWLEQLRDVMGGLSETHRTVLVLRELEGLSNAEIGDRLGVSRPAVEGLLFRARTKLRREYDELVSGRRCESVRASLDRGRDGLRLHGRDLDLAARHVRACAPCRRHAWEAGLAELLHEADRGPVRRRALTGLPLALAAFAHRVGSRVHAATRAVAEAPAALAVPWGRAAAGVTAVALVGGVTVPQAREVVTHRHLQVARVTGAVALPARSPAAAPTTLVAATVTQVLPATAPHANAPASAPAPIASPSAGPTALPAPAHEPAAAPRRPHAAPSAPGEPPAPAPTGNDTVDATVAAVHHTVSQVTAPARRVLAPTDKVAAPVEQAAAPVAQQVEQAAGDTGGALTEAVQTATAVVDQAATATPSSTTSPVPDAATPVPAPQTPAPPPVPETPAVPVPAVEPPAPPAVPDAPAVPAPTSPPSATVDPAPSDAAPVAPPHVGTLAARRRAAGIR